MSGIFYGIGVGPGDPELLTVKACRLIRQSDTIAVPKAGAGASLALTIAAEYAADKPVLYCDMPMTRDQAERDAAHDRAADEICSLLNKGQTVSFLTLGDPTIYSTCWYVVQRVAARGYQTALIPGVPSFCAAAAAAGKALCADGEQLHIIPATHGNLSEAFALSGSKVLMKAGKAIPAVRDHVQQTGESAVLVERCGLEGERIVTDLAQADEQSGYFSILLVRGDNA